MFLGSGSGCLMETYYTLKTAKFTEGIDGAVRSVSLLTKCAKL